MKSVSWIRSLILEYIQESVSGAGGRFEILMRREGAILNIAFVGTKKTIEHVEYGELAFTAADIHPAVRCRLQSLVDHTLARLVQIAKKLRGNGGVEFECHRRANGKRSVMLRPFADERFVIGANECS